MSEDSRAIEVTSRADTAPVPRSIAREFVICRFDPFVGFLHQPRHGRPALALDQLHHLDRVELAVEEGTCLALPTLKQGLGRQTLAIEQPQFRGGGVVA